LARGRLIQRLKPTRHDLGANRSLRHPRERGNPVTVGADWVPAFAGMTRVWIWSSLSASWRCCGP